MALPVDPDLELEKSPRATLPPAFKPTGPGIADVAGAALTQDNTLGSLYSLLNHPPPNPVTKPGFDPAVSIPKGYEGEAEQFAQARSPEDIEATRQQIDRRRQAQGVIQSAGLWGVAAEMAAGTVDPVTIASMFVPVGGETRLARVLGNAALGAGASAVQEVGLEATQPTRTASESIENISSTAILSGVLGAAIRPHVPKSEFDAAAARVHADLHGTTEGAIGPTDGVQRIIPETEVPLTPHHPASMTPAQAEAERVAGVHA